MILQITNTRYTSFQISAAFKKIALDENLGMQLNKKQKEVMTKLIKNGENTTEDEIQEFLFLAGECAFAININHFREKVVSNEESIAFLKSDMKRII